MSRNTDLHNRAANSEQEDARIYRERGLYQRDSGEAIANFSKAMELDPHNAVPYMNRAAVYLGNGDYDLAIADFGRVLELNPNDPDAHYHRAEVYFRIGDYDRAIADLLGALDAEPGYANANDMLGHAYFAIPIMRGRLLILT